jgi:glycosyltransferase involved in cell wall biosynthesis
VKVLYFTRSHGPHDQRFLNALSGTGHDIYYLPLLPPPPDWARNALAPSVVVEEPLESMNRFHWIRIPTLVSVLQARLERIQPDLIHAGPIHLCSCLVALAGFHPLVSMSWGSDLLWETRNPLVALAARFALARSDAFVGDCQAVKSAAMRYGMEEKEIIIFPWGVDLKHFSPGSGHELRTQLGWEEAFILLSTRSFEPLYGVELIVRAFSKVALEYPEMRLLLLGGGSELPKYEAWLRQADVMDRVWTAGVVGQEDLLNYYRAADVYVSASHSDGSSVSLLEALGSARPALVSDIPGNLEWVQPGINGWIFKDGDLSSLITSLRDVMDDRGRIGTMRAAARSIAEEKADWSKNFPKLLDAYHIAATAVKSS